MSQAHNTLRRQGIVLFGHGARDPAWAGPMQRMAARMAQSAPQVPVRLAFLEFMTPTLAAAIDDMVANGVDAIRIVPVFLAQGGHLKRDVPELVAGVAQRHPGVAIDLSPAAGEAPAVVDAIATYALEGID